MSNPEVNQHGSDADLTQRINSLESRIRMLENEMEQIRSLSIQKQGSPGYSEEDTFSLNLPWERAEEGAIETNIGEYGLAWLGNIVLFLGIAFLTHFISSKGYQLISFAIGIAAFAGILLLARSIRKSYEFLAFMFTLFAYILLFYTILRLHYFTTSPVITSRALIVVFLCLVVGYAFFEAVRRKSEGFSVMALLLAISLALLSDTTHIFLPVLSIISAVAVFFFNRFGWSRLLILSVILNYLGFFLWMINNPLMGHEMKALGFHQHCYIYLAFCGAVYSLVTLIKPKDLFPDNIILTTVLLNGFGFSIILGLVTVLFFQTSYIFIFISIAVYCLIFSAVLKFHSPWKYSPALYALYGFMAISIAIYGIFGFPKVYLFLALQSLLVVSIALWYQSRIIVVMNLFLFIFLLAGYLAQPVPNLYTNFAFPLVAFFSARIINWQKERLNIKTHLIRNTYLVLVFATTLYAVYKAVPGQYVTLAWTLVSVFYLLISIFLKLVKYRYMMFANLIVTAFYLFAVDLARIGMIYRIVAFLFLAVITIGISIYYVNKIKKKKEPVSEQGANQ